MKAAETTYSNEPVSEKNAVSSGGKSNSIRKFFSRFFPFLIIPLGLIVYLFVRDPTAEYRFRKMDQACGDRNQFLYNRIYHSPTAIEVAFIGSSRGMHAILDSNLSVGAAFDSAVCCNLAYCWSGRNFQYLILRSLLEKKQPKLVFIEIQESEDRYSHPEFPVISGWKDVFFAPPRDNRKYFSDISRLFFRNLSYAREEWFHKLPKYDLGQPQNYGQLNDQQNANGRNLMEGLQKNRKQPEYEVLEAIPDGYRYDLYYPLKMIQLLKEKKVAYAFYYIPKYACQEQKPQFISLYESQGSLYLPPPTLLADTSLWMDESHLNRKGAQRYTEWLETAYSERIGQ